MRHNYWNYSDAAQIIVVLTVVAVLIMFGLSL